MTGNPSHRRYLGPEAIERLRAGLSGRDFAILGQVADLRLMTARQIGAIHFPLTDHQGELAAARAGQRVLSRLVRDGLLVRLERRIGGVRAGSAGYVYGLGQTGQRVLGVDGPRKRLYEPTGRFVDHTLAVTELIVSVTEAARQGVFEILVLQAEPHCHRHFSGLGGRTVLRPDLFLALGVGELELRWFIEVDRGTESLPVVLSKCRAYADYYRSGREQTAHEVFPRVLWVVLIKARADRVRAAIARDRRLEERLFAVTTDGRALPVLIGRRAE
ncbi:MAG TPA: replication-relaxation family protein [Acidimicrobiales bacterium]|nr:replication-relaxation family protein [Acidimicrobiales bacterium]